MTSALWVAVTVAACLAAVLLGVAYWQAPTKIEPEGWDPREQEYRNMMARIEQSMSARGRRG